MPGPRSFGIDMTAAERALIWCELRELYHGDHGEDAYQFMQMPQPLLGDRRPLDCTFDEVMRLIDQLSGKSRHEMG